MSDNEKEAARLIELTKKAVENQPDSKHDIGIGVLYILEQIALENPEEGAKYINKYANEIKRLAL